MKQLRHFLFATIALLSISATAQVAKTVIVEHFTNTVCSVCASKNPGFFTNLAAHPAIIHMAVHPSSPYPSCILNQHNVAENDARTNYYGIYGSTPRLVINGNVVPTSTNYSAASLFTPYTGQTTPASIAIKQVKYGTDSVQVTVTVKTEAPHALGTLRLMVALCEDTIFYASPNGEQQHYNVFRKSLNNIQGIALQLPATPGDSLVFQFSSPVHAAWQVSRVFTTAILQQEANRAMVQATAQHISIPGTTTGTHEITAKSALRVYPVPARHALFVDVQQAEIIALQIFNLKGQEQTLATMYHNKLDISVLPQGVYVLQLRTRTGLHIARFVKN